MADHSPEPWQLTRPDPDCTPTIQSGDGLPVVSVDDGLTIRNARRIIACVNFCKGVPTEVLQKATLAEYEIVWFASNVTLAAFFL